MPPSSKSRREFAESDETDPTNAYFFDTPKMLRPFWVRLAILVVIVVVLFVGASSWVRHTRDPFSDADAVGVVVDRILTRVKPVLDAHQEIPYAEFVDALGSSQADAVTYNDVKRLFRLGKLTKDSLYQALSPPLK